MKVEIEHTPEAGAQPVAGVGAMLRAQRLRLGHDLGDVSEHLRIRAAYLHAIEDGRFDELPGSTYAIGFVRSYAEFLGLDGEQVVALVKQQMADALNQRTELVFPSPVSEGRIPGGAILFVALLLAAAAYGGWYYVTSSQTTVAELVPALPERLRGMVDGGAGQSGQEQAEDAGEAAVAAPTAAEGQEAVPAAEPPAVAEAPAAPADEEPPAPAASPVAPAASPVAPAAPPVAAPPAEVAAVAPPPPPVPEAAPVPAAPSLPPVPPEPAAASSEGRVFGQNNTDARIVIRATDEAWIEVRENDSLLFQRVLHKGESYRVPNRPGLTLATGSAGGLELLVDGRPVPGLGPSGAVRRDVPLDPDRLVSGNP